MRKPSGTTRICCFPVIFSDDDVEFLPLEEGGDGLDHLLGHADIRAVGAPCDVRGEHDAGNLAQRIVGGKRLMIERLNREIRRRTRVVGSFPDGNSALMLICARIRYVTANEWSTRRYLDMSRLDDNLQEAN